MGKPRERVVDLHVVRDSCPCGHVATALTASRSVMAMHDHVLRSHRAEVDELEAKGQGFKTGPLKVLSYRIRTTSRDVAAA